MPRRISVGNFPSSPPQHCASSFSQGSIRTITPSHPPSISDSMSSSLTCFPNSDGYGNGVSIQRYGSSLDVNFSQKSSSNFVHHELFIPSDVIHSSDNLQQTMELGFNSGSHELEEEPSIRELIRRLGDGYENVENAHYSSMHENAFCVRERNTLGRIGTAAADTVKPEPLFPEISRNGSMATSLRLMHVADDSFAVEMAGPGKNSGKRKSFSPEKPKEISPADLNNCCEAVEEPLKGKRQKSSVPISKEREDMKPKRSGSENSANSSTKSAKENQKPPEPPKDYIHVRARRGQATDSHSLAERVRREKISERMKFLQDLVPGCSKVTGKAVMLDEIINYVQSLQRQVEFLSMKLSAVNPRLDINLESIMAKELSHGSLPAMVMASQTGNYFQSQTLHLSDPMAYASLQDATQDHARLPIDVHAESMPQASSAWDGDLHSIVQMSFGQTLQSSADEGHHPCS